MRFVSAVLKPRPIIGIITTVIVVWIASANNVSLVWSLPAAIFWSGIAGEVYEVISKMA